MQFDGGDYVDAIFGAILAGELNEGEQGSSSRSASSTRSGPKFCDATPEQEEALQAVRDQIAAGEFDELFGAIKGEAYGGGAPVTTG